MTHDLSTTAGKIADFRERRERSYAPAGEAALERQRSRGKGTARERVDQLLETRMRSLQGASAEKEFQCKKIVALCTGVPIDKVEEVSPSAVWAGLDSCEPPCSCAVCCSVSMMRGC